MARIAELAERKNAAPKSNPVLKQIKGPSHTSFAPTTTVVFPFSVEWVVETGTKESCVFNKGTKRKDENGRRRKEETGIGRKTELFVSY